MERRNRLVHRLELLRQGAALLLKYTLRRIIKGQIAHELPRHDHLGELVRDQLVYYPTVTREPFRNQGRLPDLIANGKLCSDIGFPQIDPKQDRAMICGGPAMLKDMRQVLDQAGFTISTGIGHAGGYVIERAFVEK